MSNRAFSLKEHTAFQAYVNASGIRQVKKGDRTMRNKYEASEVVELGEAREIILGTKPAMNALDGLLGDGYRAEAVNDIDETDE